jgi:hypothetical protein
MGKYLWDRDDLERKIYPRMAAIVWPRSRTRMRRAVRIASCEKSATFNR